MIAVMIRLIPIHALQVYEKHDKYVYNGFNIIIIVIRLTSRYASTGKLK